MAKFERAVIETPEIGLDAVTAAVAITSDNVLRRAPEGREILDLFIDAEAGNEAAFPKPLSPLATRRIVRGLRTEMRREGDSVHDSACRLRAYTRLRQIELASVSGVELQG
jgi:hypothetical protein